MGRPKHPLAQYDKEVVKKTLAPYRHNFDIAIYSSENYFNVGSVFRIVHSFLAKRIWLVGEEFKFYKKATMGTHKYETVERVSLSDFLILNEHRNVVVFERRDAIPSVSLYNFSYPHNPVLFFGSEKFGVPDNIIERADQIVSISQYGIHNDLNVAVCVGIACYDFLNKCEQKAPEILL